MCYGLPDDELHLTGGRGRGGSCDISWRVHFWAGPWKNLWKPIADQGGCGGASKGGYKAIDWATAICSDLPRYLKPMLSKTEKSEKLELNLLSCQDPCPALYPLSIYYSMLWGKSQHWSFFPHCRMQNSGYPKMSLSQYPEPVNMLPYIAKGTL